MKRHIFTLSLLFSPLIAMDSTSTSSGPSDDPVENVCNWVDATADAWVSNNETYVPGSVDTDSYCDTPSDSYIETSIDNTLNGGKE